jgi:hypothetical protein
MAEQEFVSMDRVRATHGNLTRVLSGIKEHLQRNCYKYPPLSLVRTSLSFMPYLTLRHELQRSRQSVPILSVVDVRKAVAQVGGGLAKVKVRADNGEIIFLNGRQLQPVYVDTESCVLAPSTYSRVLIVLARRHLVRTA